MDRRLLIVTTDTDALHVIHLLAQQGGGTDLIGVLSTASPIVLVLTGLFALLSGKVRLEREVKERDERIAAMIVDYEGRLAASEGAVAEWKRYAFNALRIGERVTTVVEEREPR